MQKALYASVDNTDIDTLDWNASFCFLIHYFIYSVFFIITTTGRKKAERGPFQMEFNACLKELGAPIRILIIMPFSLIYVLCLDTQTSVSGVDCRVPA
jgi:hypothetical protein